jgi:hypothetical protein
MSILKNIARIAEKATGWRKSDDLRSLLCERKPQIYRFKDDGVVPNHPLWPLVIYKSAVRSPECLDPAAVFEELFDSRGWGNSWRDGIYDYVHYHSSTRRFWASLVAALGSDSEGHALNVRAGDVASPGCALQLLASKSPPLGTSVWKPPTTNFLGAAADASKYRRPVSPARSFPPGEDRLRVGGLYLLRVAGMVESHKHFMTFVRGTADRVARR